MKAVICAGPPTSGKTMVLLQAARKLLRRGRRLAYLKDLQIGRRYHFLPRLCMIQSRHSAVIAALAERPGGTRVRLEGILIV